jgi:hypothetical protein
MKKIVMIFILLPLFSFSQSEISGIVTEDINGIAQPIAGANIYWSGTSVGTVTNNKGLFVIPFSTKNKLLVFSYIGYKEQVISVLKPGTINVKLIPSSDLGTVVITAEQKATKVSLFDQRNIFTISSKEKLKAECCNLTQRF